MGWEADGQNHRHPPWAGQLTFLASRQPWSQLGALCHAMGLLLGRMGHRVKGGKACWPCHGPACPWEPSKISALPLGSSRDCSWPHRLLFMGDTSLR